jgi:hypothetical protein
MGWTRRKLATGLIGLCLSASGCSLAQCRSRTLVMEPSQCPTHPEDCQTAVVMGEVIISSDGERPPEPMPFESPSPAPVEPKTPGDQLLPVPKLQPQPTTGMLWFDTTGDVKDPPRPATSVPPAVTSSFEENTARQAPSYPEAPPAAQRWPSPTDQPLVPPLSPAIPQPDRCATAPVTVWHASKTTTDDSTVPAPSR